MSLKKSIKTTILLTALFLLSGCFPKEPNQTSIGKEEHGKVSEVEDLNKLSFEEEAFELNKKIPTTRLKIRLEKPNKEKIEKALGIEELSLASEEEGENFVLLNYKDGSRNLSTTNISLSYKTKDGYLPYVGDELDGCDLPGISVEEAKNIAENILDNLNISYMDNPEVKTVTEDVLQKYNEEGYRPAKREETIVYTEEDTFHSIFYKISLNDIELNEFEVGDMFNSDGFGANININKDGLISTTIIGTINGDETEENLSGSYSLEKLKQQLITSYDNIIGIEYVKVISVDVVYLLKDLNFDTAEVVFEPYYRVEMEYKSEDNDVKKTEAIPFFEYYSVENGSVYRE